MKINRIPIVLATFAALTIYAPFALSADATGSSISARQLQSLLNKHSSDGSDDPTKIPDHVFYEVILRQFIFNPPDFLTRDDFDALRSIPSAVTPSIKIITLSKHKNICVANTTNTSTLVIEDVAAQLDKLRKDYDTDLDKYFRSQMRTFSAQTRLEIERMRRESLRDGRVGHSSISLTGLALESPEAGALVIRDICRNVNEAIQTIGPEEEITIAEEPVILIPMGR